MDTLSHMGLTKYGALRLRLSEARDKRDMTQQELEFASKVDQSSISEYERGQALPKPETMKRLARALQMEAIIAVDGLWFEERGR